VPLPAEAIVARHRAALGAERGRVLEDLRAAVEVALSKGRSGEIALEDYLAELLLARSPRIAGQIARLVYGPLSEELARTLDMLVANSFERNATAAELPVHRNTLRDRIARITQLTGVDLDRTEGSALAWLAWLHRGGSTSRSGAAGIR
jgi:DNA-binding PucR family transcriptional regulator